MKLFSQEQLKELKSFDSPTISNAIERFDIRPRTEGFMNTEVCRILPGKEPLVGYACTGKIFASKPASAKQGELIYEYYDHVQKTPRPSIAVIQDLDLANLKSWRQEMIRRRRA